MARRPTSHANPAARETLRAVLHALRERHHAGAWAFLHELSSTNGQMPARRFDAWAMALWPSSGFTRVAYEIKLNRIDVERELRQPQKRREALRTSNLFYFVTLPGLLPVERLPAEAGLLEWFASGLRTAVEAPYRDGASASWPFVAALLRRAVGLQTGRLKLDDDVFAGLTKAGL